MEDVNQNTRQKALALNVDAMICGTFAEIGAAQEGARWFFSRGGATWKTAMSSSARYMAVSNWPYGAVKMKVSGYFWFDNPLLTIPSYRAVRASALPLLLLALLILGGCDRKSNSFAPSPPAEVIVAHPVNRPVARYLEATGTTEAFESVELRARVPGFLDQIQFAPGATVKKGDLLFVIDKRTYQAAVAAAEATLAQHEAELVYARADFQRAEGLRATSAASQLEWEEKKRTLQVSEARVAAAKAALETTRLDLEFCDVRAPFDGRITRNVIDVGNYVGAGGQATVLAKIVSVRPIYVTIDASESDYIAGRNDRLARTSDAKPGEIAPGQWRPVELATGQDESFRIKGHIDYVAPEINPQTGTARVRCRFENEDDQLLPGMFVRLRVWLQTAPSVVVPDIALLSDQSGRYALVVNEQDVVELRRVKIGSLDGTMRAVAEGLAESDRVIVNGLQRARPGAIVKTVVKEIGLPPTTAATTSKAQ